MENLHVSPTSSEVGHLEGKFATGFASLFQPVEVLRPLGTYGRLLNLEQGAKAPDPEFLVRLLTGHTSHQACIRRAAGSHFKNFENLIRGKHKLSPTTKQVLAKNLGLSFDVLEDLVGSAPDGPLMPQVLALFQLAEEIPAHLMSTVFSREVNCPCCGKNLLDDAEAWWTAKGFGSKLAEYRFAERLMNALLGVSLIELMLNETSGAAEPVLRIDSLASAQRHPIGNWLMEAQNAMSCGSLAELAVALQLCGKEKFSFSHGRLKKWSAGLDVMPLEAGEFIAFASGQSNSGMRRLWMARTIALVTDFIEAAMPAELYCDGSDLAREIVSHRLTDLHEKLLIAVAERSGKLTLRARSPEYFDLGTWPASQDTQN